jgi:hypothetical protein
MPDIPDIPDKTELMVSANYLVDDQVSVNYGFVLALDADSDLWNVLSHYSVFFWHTQPANAAICAVPMLKDKKTIPDAERIRCQDG